MGSPGVGGEGAGRWARWQCQARVCRESSVRPVLKKAGAERSAPLSHRSLTAALVTAPPHRGDARCWGGTAPNRHRFGAAAARSIVRLLLAWHSAADGSPGAAVTGVAQLTMTP